MTKRGRPAAVAIEAPPPEQASAFEITDITDKAADGRSIRLGKAYRRVSMINTLAKAETITPDEAKALRHYRHHADIADRSPLRDSIAGLMRISGGGGHAPGVELLNAVRVRDDCERAAGSLSDILRAVAVDDVSLSQWAMARAGAVEEGGKLRPPRKALRIAQIELRLAAKRVQAELDA